MRAKKPQQGRDEERLTFASGGREVIYMGRTDLNFEIHEAV